MRNTLSAGMRKVGYAVFGCVALAADVALASGGPIFTHGIVYTRGLVLGPNNAPIFAEFDENGIASDIPSLPNGGEATGALADAQVMDATTYYSIEQAYRQYLADNETGVALGARVMSANDYQTANLGTIIVPQAGGADLVLPVPRAALLQGSRSALIRDNQTIPDPRLLGDRGVILFEAPIDLSSGNLQTLDIEQVNSLIIDGDGRVIHSSENNIGFRAAYIRPENGSGDPAQDHISFYRRGDDLWGGIDGARIETALGGLSSTSDGRFTVIDFIPPCPGFLFEYNFNIYALLQYRNFNPQLRRPFNSYYFRTQAFEVCNGYGEIPLGFTLTGLSVTLTLQGIAATTATSSYTHRMPVDIVMFNGLGELANPDGATLPVGDVTEYDATVAEFADVVPPHLDFNLDQTTDWVSDPGSVPGSPGGPAMVGVYLGETGQYDYDDSNVPLDADGNPVDPDLVRLADQAADFEDRGLLSSISVADLDNTDIYVYRVSNGQLIVSKQGLNRVIGTAQGVDAEQDRFYYKLIVPGPKSGFALPSGGGANLEPWQRGLGLENELIGRDIDSLRPGEPVKIIAINRATGYIGSVTVPIEAPTSGSLDFPVERILMRPPNLKLRAERLYRARRGTNDGPEREFLIGSEGSGLTTDTYIALYTEWLDHNDTPLPDDLDGYSARLAKIVDDNQLANANGSAAEFFEIKPGKHVQLLKLEGDILGTEHFYLHVNGTKTADPSDFSPDGGTGVLEYRPGRYVPIRVPVYDEPATRLARNTVSYAGNNPNDIDAIYRWPYRPEMQFSVFDLEQIDLRYTDENAQLQTIDLNTQVIGDTVNLFDSSLTYVELLYDLAAAAFGALQPFGPLRELVFAIGEEEAFAALGDDGMVRFEHLDHLTLLNSSDLLTISLYQNSDAANILWQYDIEGLAIDSSDNADSDLVNSFVIVPQAGIRQTDGTTLNSPQDPFIVQLLNPIGSGDSYKWEIVVPDKDKYGTFQFVGAAPTGQPIDNVVTNPDGSQRTEYIWRSADLTDPQFRRLQFRPVELTPRHTPQAYTKFSGGTRDIDVRQKNPRYTYDIKVTVTSAIRGPRTYTGQIQMDDQDMIRQEFITHMTQVPNISDIVRVPMRDDLVEKESLQGVLTGEWSSADYSHLYEKHMSLMANLVRNAFVNQPMQSYPQPGGGTGTLPSGLDLIDSLRLNSGWRNPERNEIVGGASTSRHMVGRATDIGASGVFGYGDATTNRAHLMWTLWNTALTLPASQANGPRFRWLLEDADGGSSPFGVRIAETGTVVSGNVPDVIPTTDMRGARPIDAADGIPDAFNYASHLHAETKPSRACASGQVAWNCE